MGSKMRHGVPLKDSDTDNDSNFLHRWAARASGQWSEALSGFLGRRAGRTEHNISADFRQPPSERAEAILDDRVSAPSAFSDLNSVLQTHFFEPDLQAIRIVLGTIKAHYLNIGDPAWLFVVAPPGSGKTTLSIMGAAGLPQVIPLSEFTENTFLSGFHGHAQPGLLEKLGIPIEHGGILETEGNAIFLAKDFTTVLSMRREKRAVILGQLREIHDGSFKRAFGTGVTKAWKGRITIIAAVTPILDTHYSIFSVLGERFLQVRWHRPKSEEAGEWAIRQQGREAEIQRQCREAITRIFENSTSSAPTLPTAMRKRIASLAEVVALGRTHIIRNSWGREIEYVPEPEANTRVSKGLAAIAKGVAALNQHTEVAEDDLQDAFRVGLDCIPDSRKRLILAVRHGEQTSSVPLPRTVRDRELEELEALGILSDADPPELSQRVAKLLEVAAPELG
jgi:hypothetical protein